MSESEPILSIKNLTTAFHLPEGDIISVSDVSLHIRPQEIVSLVGESGCGKTVTALSIMRLIAEPPGKITQGEIVFLGSDLLKLSPHQMRKIRGNEIAMIFQEPMTCLNPLYTVGNQISEVFAKHKNYSRRRAWTSSVEIMQKVGISSPEQRACQYIHEMSGGMRQRAMIAMALACNPKLLIADEPTTALDVTIQAQILDLMKNLQKEIGASILLISHNLGVVAEVAHRVAVMYLGRIVEEADVDAIFNEPLHPYTRGLIASIPFPGRKALVGKRKLEEIPGSMSSLHELPKGCFFRPRCSLARDVCHQKAPTLLRCSNDHKVACWAVAAA
jgi:peptide/nickel transport system ATP-binding protein